MTTIVNQGELDLYNLKIGNETDEGKVERVMLSQVKRLLLDKGYNCDKINTIFLNKVIYFSANKIFNNKNPGLLLSGGWYKYGPCYEKGRVGEGTRLFLEPLQPSKRVLEEVEIVFNEEFPLFIKSAENDDQFYHSYLDHIYKQKQEHDELKDFYLTKNEVCFNAYNLAFNKEGVSSEQFRKNLLDFEKAALDKDYLGFTRLNEDKVDRILKLISLVGETLIKYTEQKDSLNDDFLEFQIKSMAFNFDKFIQMPFADKNYIATFKTNNAHFKLIKKDEMEKQFAKHNDYIETKLTETIELMEPYKTLLM